MQKKLLTGDVMSAQNTTTHNVEVTDNGSTANVIKNIETLIKSLKAAQQQASATFNMGTTSPAALTANPRTSAPTPGGTVGSRNVAEGLMSGSAYGVSRATAGGTGAASRDFAKESQGLGGLVRLYATYAANVFAVGAAFTALREAAGTENLIKGLDNLGAASGRNLGSLAKQLVATTDGALSLRDAMTAVSQASSAGLGNKQINDIAVVAGKASQALGISMTDAISRLSRGISKIEPELLDELGIFVKVDEATNKYALSVGKTASSLSNFEKRQAFANAVLEQGKEKFAAIETVANPYDKLLASVNNLSSSSLTLLNTVLTPIVKLLAESPTALLAVFGYIGTILVSKAIPSLTLWREELTKSAEVSAAAAKRSYEAFRQYSIDKNLEEEAKKVGPAQRKINEDISVAQTALAKTLGDKSKILTQAMTGTTDPATMAKSVNTELTRRQSILDRLAETAKNDLTADAAKKASYDSLLAKQKEEIANLQVANTLYKTAAEETKALNAIKQTHVQRDEVENIEEKAKRKASEVLKQRADAKSVLAQVGTDTQIKGVSAAFKSLFENIREGIPQIDENDKVSGRLTDKLKGLGAVTTGIKGSFLILGSAIATGLSAIAPYLELFGLLVVAYELFNSVASSAAKQQDEFDSKIKTGEDSIDAATKTIDLYSTKKQKAFSVEGIVAYTNALSEISTAYGEQLDALDKFTRNAGWFDNLKDSIAGIFGRSNTDKLKKNAVASIQTVIKTVEFSINNAKSRDLIAETLGFGTGAGKKLDDIEAVKKAVQGLDNISLQRLGNQFKAIEESEQATTNAAKSFMESLTEIDKLVDQMIQANGFTDLQGKIGVELVNASNKLAQALMDPLKALQDIAAIGKDPKMLAIIGTQDLQQLVKAEQIIYDINQTEKELVKNKAEAEKAKSDKSAVDYLSFSQGGGGSTLMKGEQDFSNLPEINNAKKATETAVSDTERQLNELKTKAQAFSLEQVGLVARIADEGFKRISIGLKLATEEAKNTVTAFNLKQANTAGLGTAEANYQLKISELEIQKSLIQANYNAEIATIKNTDELTRLTTALELTRSEATVAKATVELSKEGLTPAQKEIAAAELKTAEMVFQAATKASQQINAKFAMQSGTTFADAKKQYGEIPATAAQASIKIDSEVEIKRKYALAKLNAETVIAGKQKVLELTAEERKYQLGLIDIERDRIKNDDINISNLLLIDILGGKRINNAKKDYDTEALANEVLKSRIELTNQLDDIEKSYRETQKTGKGVTEKEYLQTKEIVLDRLRNLDIYKAEKTLNIEINAIRRDAALREQNINRIAEVNLQTLTATNSISLAYLQLAEKRIDLELQLGKIDEKNATNRKADIEQAKRQYKYEEDLVNLQKDQALKQDAQNTAEQVLAAAELKATDLKIAQQVKLAELQATQDRLQQLKTGITTDKAPPTALGTIDVQAKRETDAGVELAKASLERAKGEKTATDLKVSSATIRNKLSEDEIELARKLNLELIAQKEHLQNISDVTEGLASVFGKFGKSIGGVVSSLDQMAVNDQKRKEALKREVKDTEDYRKVQAKNTSGELGDAQKVIGSVKNVFKEKTFAYKAISVLEHEIAYVKLAMDAKKMISESLVTGSFLSNSAIRIGQIVAEAEIDSVGAVIKTMSSLPFPFNIAAAATVAVIMGTLLAQIGGKGPGLTGGAENTGTGTTLGNKTASSQTVNNAKEVLGKADPILMRYSSEMVKYLRNIDANIANLGTSLVRALGGSDVATGKVGVQTGTISPATNVLSGILGGATGFGALSGLGFGAAGGMLGGGATSILLDVLLPGIGALIGTLLGSKIFKSSTYVTGQGIQAGPQSLQDIKGQGFQGQYYADTVTKNRVFGIAVNSSKSTEYAALESSIKRDLGLIFTNMGDTLISSSKVLGQDTTTITDKVNSFVINLGKINLQDLTTEEQQKRFEAVVGQQLDLLVESTYPQIAEFTKVGEGLGTTLAKVVYGVESATNGLNMLGIQAIKYTDILNKQGDIGGEIVRQSILATETQTLIKQVIENANGSAQDILDLYTQLDTLRDKLVDLGIAQGFLTREVLIAAGGTDKFSDSIGKFYDNFTTETQKTQIETAKATEVFTKLGIAIPSSREGFYNLFKTLTVSAPESAAALLKVIDAIDVLYKTADKTADEAKTLQDKLAELTATQAELRQLEINKLAEGNKIWQKRIYATMDLQAAAKAYQTSLQNITKTLTTQVTALKDYKAGLLSGTNSTLTTSQQYATTKTEMDNLVSTILDSKTTAEDRNTAVNKLSSVTDKYLSLSRDLFASGPQYAKDFDSVLQIIDKTTTGLEDQKSIAQQQLDSLELTENYLKSIDETNKTTNDLLADYNAAVAEVLRLYQPTTSGGGTTGGGTTGGSEVLFNTSVQALVASYMDWAQIQSEPGAELTSALDNLQAAFADYTKYLPFRTAASQGVSEPLMESIRRALDLSTSNAIVDSTVGAIDSAGIAAASAVDKSGVAASGAIATSGTEVSGAVFTSGTAAAGAVADSGVAAATAIGVAGNQQTTATVNALNNNIDTFNTSIATNNQVVVDQIVIGFDAAADRIIQAINAGAVATVIATDNNTQQIAGTINNTASMQVNTARLINRATATYKITDLNMVDQ